MIELIRNFNREMEVICKLKKNPITKVKNTCTQQQISVNRRRIYKLEESLLEMIQFKTQREKKD